MFDFHLFSTTVEIGSLIDVLPTNYVANQPPPQLNPGVSFTLHFPNNSRGTGIVTSVHNGLVGFTIEGDSRLIEIEDNGDPVTSAGIIPVTGYIVTSIS